VIRPGSVSSAARVGGVASAFFPSAAVAAARAAVLR